MNNLFKAAYQCLVASDVDRKLTLVSALADDWQMNNLADDADVDLPETDQAGRPERPDLVAPRLLPRRRIGTEQGQAAMIHAIAHIEFNAINLAIDAVYRFRHMPTSFYADWIQVAAEEVYHFSLINDRLRLIGYQYGDFPAHNGLWELAQKTAADPLVRMALVPRVMEARGLDVTPDIMQKFKRIGDEQTVDILQIILDDEIGHVQAGTRWFHYLCRQCGLEPESTYFKLLSEYLKGNISCPLHIPARLEAGFSESELDRLQSLCKGR